MLLQVTPDNTIKLMDFGLAQLLPAKWRQWSLATDHTEAPEDKENTLESLQRSQTANQSSAGSPAEWRHGSGMVKRVLEEDGNKKYAAGYMDPAVKYAKEGEVVLQVPQDIWCPEIALINSD